MAANIQGGQTTQSVVIPMQRIAPITQGQTLYTVDLSGQITGEDPATRNPVTLNGNLMPYFCGTMVDRMLNSLVKMA